MPVLPRASAFMVATSLAAVACQPAPAGQAAAGDDRSPQLRRLSTGWQTDWTRRTIDTAELASGGVARGQIPALVLSDSALVPDAGAPVIRIETAAQAGQWLTPTEPVIALSHGGAARAYPLRILTWHEIANDRVGGLPVAVTYCPLCNAGVVFRRSVAERELEFEVSGLLRHSDLVMVDRQTDSLWQQLDGSGLVGEYAGASLEVVPALLISWADFRSTYPHGDVLAAPEGDTRRYGTNPYAGYDSSSRPFLFRAEPDRRLPALARVLGLAVEAQPRADGAVLEPAARAYGFDDLARARLVNDYLGGVAVVVWWEPGTASAVDSASLADGRDVGAAAAFNRSTAALTDVPAGVTLPAGELTFRRPPAGSPAGVVGQDEDTGSLWNIAGGAVAGPLTGAALGPLAHQTPFWFAWAALRPETDVWTPH